MVITKTVNLELNQKNLLTATVFSVGVNGDLMRFVEKKYLYKIVHLEIIYVIKSIRIDVQILVVISAHPLRRSEVRTRSPTRKLLTKSDFTRTDSRIVITRPNSDFLQMTLSQSRSGRGLQLNTPLACVGFSDTIIR